MSVDAFSELDDMLSGGGISAFRQADPVGSVFEGPIVNIGKKQQQIDFKTRQPKTYDDGNPMWQIPVTIQTTRRDPESPSDDGSRTLYMKGKLLGAIRQALRDAGNAKLRPGGYLWVQFTGWDGDAKEYAARYTPNEHADVDNLTADAGPAVATQAASVLNGNPHSTAAPVASVPAPETNAAAIAAKLAAAVAPPAPAPNPLLAGLSTEQQAAIRNLSAEQATGAGLEAVWNALQS